MVDEKLNQLSRLFSLLNVNVKKKFKSVLIYFKFSAKNCNCFDVFL
jgi:hypothetical protein